MPGHIALVMVVLFIGVLLVGVMMPANAGSFSFSKATTPPPVDASDANLKNRDATYAAGKDIFFGRAGHTKYEYCVSVKKNKRKFVPDPGGKNQLPLSRKSMRAFKGVELLPFLNSVFDCAKPNKLAFKYFEGEEFWHLLYYFNKRYNLRLDDKRLRASNEKLRKQRSD